MFWSRDSLKRAEESVAINLLGTIRMTYAFLPQLVRKNDGIIINVSSALAFVPFHHHDLRATKARPFMCFTEGLRVQLAGSPVRVIELVPRRAHHVVRSGK